MRNAVGQAPADPTVLRGAAIREAAVRALLARGQGEAPVNYRDWFEVLGARGIRPGGKDPLATFLTQIGRSPLVKRSTAAGMYALDLEFPQRARAQLERLSVELAAIGDIAADATVEEIAKAREHRARLTAEMEDVARRLEEATRCLGADAAA
jgi:hypothetical protein